MVRLFLKGKTMPSTIILHPIFLFIVVLALGYHTPSHGHACFGRLPKFLEGHKPFNKLTLFDVVVYLLLCLVAQAKNYTLANSWIMWVFALGFLAHAAYWIMHTFIPSIYYRIHNHLRGGSIYSDGQFVIPKACAIVLDTIFSAIGTVFVANVLYHHSPIAMSIALLLGVSMYIIMWWTNLFSLVPSGT